jgi:hypothetical protein
LEISSWPYSGTLPTEDAEVGGRGDVDVVEADPVAHDRPAAAQALLVRAVEPDDRAGDDGHGLRVDGDLEALLDVEAAAACVDHLAALGLEHRTLERDVAVDAVIEHHDGRPRPSLHRSSHPLPPVRRRDEGP